MGKRVLFTTITPLPANIPRKLATALLQNHKEMIELNPLVIEHHPIKAPKNAAADEFFAVWHEMTDRVQYVPGMGKLASSKVSYKGVFHDMPWGLQTHIYAPLGLDIRDKWQIRGNQPGEPREARELGDKAPHDGLYLREDVDMTCPRMMVGFVKKNLINAHAVLVDRLLKKAELLDAGVLQAMMEEGRLKTINPAVRDSFAKASHMPQSPQLPPQMPPGPYSPQMLSPQMQPRQMEYSQMHPLQMHSPQAHSSQTHPSQTHSSQTHSSQTHSPQTHSPHHSYYSDPKIANHPAFRNQDDASRQSEDSRHSSQGQLPPYQDNGAYHNDMAKTTHLQTSTSASAYARQAQYAPPPSRQFAAELPGSIYHQSQRSPNLAPTDQRNSGITELSGSSPAHKNFPSPNMGGSDRSSVTSELPNSHSHNNSFYTSYTNTKGMPSPGLPSDRTSMVSGISEMATPPMHQHGFQPR
jgi:hypothetical protein